MPTDVRGPFRGSASRTAPGNAQTLVQQFRRIRPGQLGCVQRVSIRTFPACHRVSILAGSEHDPIGKREAQMDRQATAVAYRERLRAELSDCLSHVDVNALTLTELKDVLLILQPALARQRRQP